VVNVEVRRIDVLSTDPANAVVSFEDDERIDIFDVGGELSRPVSQDAPPTVLGHALRIPAGPLSVGLLLPSGPLWICAQPASPRLKLGLVLFGPLPPEAALKCLRLLAGDLTAGIAEPAPFTYWLRATASLTRLAPLVEDLGGLLPVDPRAISLQACVVPLAVRSVVRGDAVAALRA
jgi:hypothetical protein